jgi:hypothetical protein
MPALVDEIVRVTEGLPKPPYTVQPGQFTELQLKINGVSDIIRTQLDTTEIALTPTMMFQSRFDQVRGTNPSAIPLEYAWAVRQRESRRTTYTATRSPPFRVHPSSGCIEGGGTTVFKMTFSPEEVDDFTGILRMKILFLTMDSPTILEGVFTR